MSKNSKRNASKSRADRFTQMSKQEEIIAEKKRLIEAKLKMMQSQEKTEPAENTSKKDEIATKQSVLNTFSNDGSFLEKFKKISGTPNSSAKPDESKSDKRTPNKTNRNYNNDNYNRSNNSSRWNNKKEEQHNYRDYGQNPYHLHKSHEQNAQQSSYNTNYSPANLGYQHNDYSTPEMHRNHNLPMDSMRCQNFQESQGFQNDSFMKSNPPQQMPLFPNNGNNVNNWNNPSSINPMTNYNPSAGQSQIPSTAHIPALTSLRIPPPTSMQIPSTTNVQIPPPSMQPNLSVPPPCTISLQSIPEPKPLEAMSIPRPGPLNLHTIPPPLPMCINQIPKPKDIDVRNIPPPKQFNVAGIEMPSAAYKRENSFYGENNPVLSTDNPMSQSQDSNRQCDMNQTKQQKPECNPIERVAKLVVEIGDGYEEIFKQKHQHEPEFWFLFHQNSTEYSEYRKLVKKLKEDKSNQSTYSPEELYEPEFSLNDEDDDIDSDVKVEKYEEDNMAQQSTFQKSLVSSYYDDANDGTATDNTVKIEKTDPDETEENRRKRKRRSRWGNEQDIKPVVGAPGLVQVPNLGGPAITLPANVAPLTTPAPNIPINRVTRTDRALLQYAKNTFGTTDLSEEDWIKAEDHFKINLLYQEMLRKRKELDQLARSGKHKYEYDSDEEVDGGTWEHKLRSQEMEATQKWADELTKQSEGKHHIGDFLPPEELKKFMEKYSAAKNGREPDLSDYKEYKLNETNVGFQMLQKLGWKDGEGLGTSGSGIVEPVNKATNRGSNQGLGLDRPDNVQSEDNEYEAYRKRMMLAYRFRPNPLNNPRRPYY